MFTTSPQRATKKKGEEIAGGGLAGAGASDRVVGEGVAGAGVAGAGKKSRKTGGAHLNLKDLGKMNGQPPDTLNAKVTVQAKPWNSEEVEARAPAAEIGEARKKRSDLVRELMKNHKLSLPEASKHIQVNKLH